MPPPVPPVPVVPFDAVALTVVPAAVVEVEVDVEVAPPELVVLVTVAVLSFAAGSGEENTQAPVSPRAVRARAKRVAKDASKVMRKLQKV